MHLRDSDTPLCKARHLGRAGPEASTPTQPSGRLLAGHSGLTETRSGCAYTRAPRHLPSDQAHLTPHKATLQCHGPTPIQPRLKQGTSPHSRPPPGPAALTCRAISDLIFCMAPPRRRPQPRTAAAPHRSGLTAEPCWAPPDRARPLLPGTCSPRAAEPGSALGRAGAVKLQVPSAPRHGRGGREGGSGAKGGARL